MTLRDVARSSGVSITTVSRILNGRESGVPIRDDTRQRVLDVAAEMGYKPNLLARGLRGSRSSLLGVIARDISDPFHIQILRGINEVAQARDYRLFLGHVDYRPEVALTYGSMFESSHADGIIIIGDIAGRGFDTRGVRRAAPLRPRRHRPDDAPPDPGCLRRQRGGDGPRPRPPVGPRPSLDHLRVGHADLRRPAPDRAVRAVHAGAWCRRADPGPRLGAGADLSLQLGRRIFADFDHDTSPTAIFATSDTIAMGLMQAAFQAGIAMPGRISVIGFDDIDFASYTIPPLTTVSQNGVEMGRIATEVLLDMIDNARDRADVNDVVLRPHLVVRGSTAAPFR